MSPSFVDVSTVFSIAPFEVFATKPGLLPGTYRIPACVDQTKPQRLLVKSGLHLMQVGGKKHPIRIETASHVIAKSIVDDCINEQLQASSNCHPGLAWIYGDISIEQFTLLHKDVYESILMAQKRWFVARCKMVDNDWSRYHNTRVASDIDKFAARALGLEPEWMKTEEILNFNKCVACGTMNDKTNIICSNCKLILDVEKYRKLEFAK